MLFNNRQAEQAKWQETEYLLRILFSRLNLMLICPDTRLDNNIRMFVRALRDGQSIHELHSLMKDISGRINKLKGSSLIASPSEKTTGDTSSNEENLVFDVFLVLLDNIHFPTNVAGRIEQIRFGLTDSQVGDKNLRLVSAITSLTTILDEIFERVDKDKQKIDKFLKQINSDLQSMDEGIAESHKLHSEKQELDTSIDLKVTSEVHEMENMLSSQSGVEAVKTNVLGSLKTIRSHMETFKQQEQDRNKRAQAVTKELQGKLNQMENECSYLKQQVLEKHDHVLSDSLTGVRNRLAYEEAIQTECDRFSRYGRPLSLLVMSIDDFQNIGKHYGEGSGDMVLQVVAKILANSIRNVDFLARYGGEDFVIIFPELGMKDARLVGQKICKTIAEERIEIGGNKFNISISGGIARMHDDDNPKSLHERADSALTLAKQRGGNKVEIE